MFDDDNKGDLRWKGTQMGCEDRIEVENRGCGADEATRRRQVIRATKGNRATVL